MPDYRVVVDLVYSTTEEVDIDELHDAIMENLESVDLEFEYSSTYDLTSGEDREDPLIVGVNADVIRSIELNLVEE